MRIAVSCIAVGVLWMSQPARAEAPYYFNKPGIGRDAYMADVADCARLAGGVISGSYRFIAVGPNVAYGALAAGIASFFGTLMQRKEHRRLVSRVERTCMADKGYQRRSIDKGAQAEIAVLEGNAKIDRLFALVAAEKPLGQALIE